MAINKFTRMIINAKKGDVESIRELRGYVYEKSGVANKRLRSLERTGLTEYAYGRAYTYLNSEYQSIKFPQATAHRDVDDLIQQAQELHTFLNSPTSKVRGARIARERQLTGLNQLRELGYNIPTDSASLGRINKVLGNDGLKIYGQYRYALMEAIDQAFETGSSEAEINTIVNRYASGEITYEPMIKELLGK